MTTYTAWRLAKPAAWIVLAVGVYAGGLFTFVTVANADLYGRLIETMRVSDVVSKDSTDDIPTVRLVLHRLPPDENVVEASLVLMVDGGALAEGVRAGKVRLAANVRDGSTYQPFAIQNSVTLDAQTAEPEPCVFPLAAQSTRFVLPALPSVNGFPFDDLTVRPIVGVRRDGFSTSDYHFEVQKALPGRLLTTSKGLNPVVTLTRSSTEKALVLVSASVFLLLSAILGYGLFMSSKGLTTLDQMLAVGGYLIAAVGFRELLGVSRSAGTSTLEIGVIGIPILSLALCVVASFFRGRRHLTN